MPFLLFEQCDDVRGPAFENIIPREGWGRGSSTGEKDEGLSLKKVFFQVLRAKTKDPTEGMDKRSQITENFQEELFGHGAILDVKVQRAAMKMTLISSLSVGWVMVSLIKAGDTEDECLERKMSFMLNR